MMKWLMDLLISRKFKFEHGQIDLLGEKVFILPVNFIYEETKYAVQEGMQEIMDMYSSAWVAGYWIMKKFVKLYNLKKFEERYKIAMDVLQLAGMGDYKTVDFEHKHHTRVMVMNNPLPKKFYPSKDPMCHFIRGANAGGGTWVHEKIMNCLEEKCIAQGENACIFLNANTELLKTKVDPKVVDSQLDLDMLLEKEQKFIKEQGDEDMIEF